jgi:hypothetical protein
MRKKRNEKRDRERESKTDKKEKDHIMKAIE